MKKYILLAMLCVATMSGMAQHHHGQTPPPPPPATQNHGHHHGQTPPPPAQPGHHHGQTPPPPAQPGHHHGQTPPPPAPKPVICATAEQMQMVIQVMDKQSYDDKRMEIARLCVMLGHFCTRDLTRMASRFTQEDRKVDFLRYAYRYCQDPENYYTVRDVLRYRSDYERVMEVCQPHHRRPW